MPIAIFARRVYDILQEAESKVCADAVHEIGGTELENYFQPNMTLREVNAMSALALAHIGDGVFELLVRTELCLSGDTTNKKLHHDTVARVCAAAQAEFADRLVPLLTPDEAAFYRRGRNAHPHSMPKNAAPVQYAKATGVETLFGALYLLGQRDRIQALFAEAKEA